MFRGKALKVNILQTLNRNVAYMCLCVLKYHQIIIQGLIVSLEACSPKSSNCLYYLYCYWWSLVFFNKYWNVSFVMCSNKENIQHFKELNPLWLVFSINSNFSYIYIEFHFIYIIVSNLIWLQLILIDQSIINVLKH